MRVGIIHHQFARKGGMERYIFDLLTEFGQRGDVVDLFVYKKEPHLDVPEHCTLHQKKINWLPRKLRKYFFSRKISTEKIDCDIVFSTMRSFSQDINICGGTHPGFLEFTQRRPKFFDKFEIAAERRGFEASKKIVAHSNLIRDEIIRYYGMPDEKVVRIFPPVDTKKFNVSAREQREVYQQKFTIDPNKLTLLFPSTGHKRKGLYELLDAFRGLPNDVELLIAGSGCKEVEGLPNVRSCGFVDDMPALYAAVDGVVLPSHYEPFGLVVTESLACGTPVIISKFVGAKDVVDEGSGIVLSEVSATDIRQAIEAFGRKNFKINEAFVAKHKLDLDTHINQLISVIGE